MEGTQINDTPVRAVTGAGGVSAVVPVDLHIKGCPPRPWDLLNGLLALMQDTKAESPRD